MIAVNKCLRSILSMLEKLFSKHFVRLLLWLPALIGRMAQLCPAGMHIEGCIFILCMSCLIFIMEEYCLLILEVHLPQIFIWL